MANLTTAQRTIEKLYYLDLEDDEECRCKECNVCKTNDLLKKRIKSNLRLVLCDIIMLKLIMDDTLLE